MPKQKINTLTGQSEDYASLQEFEAKATRMPLSQLIEYLTDLKIEVKMSPEASLAERSLIQMQLTVLAKEIDRREAEYRSGADPKPKPSISGSFKGKVRSLGGLV